MLKKLVWLLTVSNKKVLQSITQYTFHMLIQTLWCSTALTVFASACSATVV